MKVLTILGARPQFIKAACVSHVFAETDDITEVLLHTGQHFDVNMSDVFFEELGIPEPAYNLGVGASSHGAMTGAQLAGAEEVLLEEQPDWALVYGDTNSTLAGALAAAKLHIPVGHVEAGLRSFNRRMPEEINRIVADHISTLLLAPTVAAMDNLQREGIPIQQCYNVGDVMFDAAIFFGNRAAERSDVLNRLKLEGRQFVLATVHRAENTDQVRRLRVILDALRLLADRLPVIWPVHPRTRNVIDREQLGYLIGGGVRLIEPLGYLDMVMLERNAAVIATDSGGMQKEAFFHGVPCVTLRAETEWVELVEGGWNTLVPPRDPAELAAAIAARIGVKGRDMEPYGDGNAAAKIASLLSGAASVSL